MPGELRPNEVLARLESQLAGLGASERALEPARAGAAGMLQGTANGEATGLAAIVFAADVVSGVALERTWAPPDLREVAASVARIARLPLEFAQAGICLRVLRDPRLLELPPRLAVETQLCLVYALAPVQEVSLWNLDEEGQLDCPVYFGEGAPTRRVRAVARALLRGGSDRSADGNRALIQAVPVLRWQRPHGALVVRTRSDERERGLAFAREAAAMVRPALEKETLLERGASRQDSLVESSERRLVRLGFDLHDGAIQDIAALASDVRHFRDQIGRVLSDDERRELLLGRVDDLEARLVAIDGDLRELARSFESSTIAHRPFEEVLRREIRAFSGRTEIRSSLAFEGDFSSLTASQRIALVRIVQEALANVREHSGANEVHISVLGGRGYVRAEVGDNGRGFDVERTLMNAARSGRLGLVGMSERVRLLGGSFDVLSRPGGPTTISVTLPEWHPFSEGQITRHVEPEREEA